MLFYIFKWYISITSNSVEREEGIKPRKNVRIPDVWPRTMEFVCREERKYKPQKVESRENRSGWQLSADRCYVVMLCTKACLMPYMDIFPPYGNPQLRLFFLRVPNGERFPPLLISHPETAKKKLSNNAVIGYSLCKGDLWQLKILV